MIKKTIFRAVLAALLAVASSSFAEDIDLYVGGEQVTGVTPNVLIVLDNSTNWASNSQHWPDGGKQGVSELQSLSEIVGMLKGKDINVGLMMFARDGGGLVRYAVRDMSVGTPNNAGALQDILTYMAANAVNGSDADEVPSSTNYDEMMNSAFRYFNGLPRWKDGGSAQDRRDFNGNTNNTAAQPSFSPYALGNYSLDSATATSYNPPAQASTGCAKNFIIFIGNGFPSSVSGSANDLTAAAALIGVTAKTGQITPISPKNPYADEWVRFMHEYGVKTNIPDPADATKVLYNPITTYTIDVCKDACEPPQETLLRSMATVGGGRYFKSTSKNEIKTALAQIFAEIQAVNSVFASASLPVSVNTQGTYENQVYIGLFRPDGNARPRWFGNLKEYKFARYCDTKGRKIPDPNDPLAEIDAPDDKVQDDEKIADSVTDTSFCLKENLKLYLADRNNNPAIDQTRGTGFIDLNAVSYWTVPENPGFWTFLPDSVAGTDDSPDGPLVERGGAAFKLRGQYASGRNVYTCLGGCLSTSGSPLSGGAFDTGNTAVKALLQPTGAKSVTLARSAGSETVTATVASGGHGFSNGETVIISGATPAEYNGSRVIVTTADPNVFTYQIVELPTSDTSGLAQVGTGVVSVNIAAPNGIVVDEASGIATVTTSAAHGLSAGENVTIAGASQPFLNGSKSATVISSTQFSYAVTLPTPVTPATAAGTSKSGAGAAINNTSVRLASTSPRTVVVITASNHNYVTGASVTVAGTTPTDYSWTWEILGVGTACPGVANSDKNKAYCFKLIKPSESAAGMTMTRALNPVSIKITRAIGSTNATAVRSDGLAFPTPMASMTIFGSTQNEYNKTWNSPTFSDGDKTATFGAVALSPSAAPGGTASAAPSATVPAESLISWVRGTDNYEDENYNRQLTDVRASIHADVLHSRPLMLNYGSAKGIVGFYGSNDGMLHAIKAGTADSDGVEKWAFIPEEFVNKAKLARLYFNSPQIRYPNLSCDLSPNPQPRSYFWDGAVSGYQTADGTATSAPTQSLIFATMRRGGRSVYALDVSDPDNPKHLWRISNTTTGFSELGQTWSEVKPIELKGAAEGGGAVYQTVVVFGAGFDADQEDMPAGSARAPTMGRGVYVVDMQTGARLAFLEPPGNGTKYSFAGDVTPVDSDGDGYVDRIYAADTGGNVFRFDAEQTSAPGTVWKAYHLAKLGDVGNDGGSDARKFLFPPSVIPFADPASNRSGWMVMIGSGDREKPLKNPVTPTCPAFFGGTSTFGTAVQDRFYSVLDTVIGSEDPASVTPIVEGDLQEVNAAPDALAPFAFSSTKKGWLITLKYDPPDGNTNLLDEEKAVNAPQVVGGVVYFSTNTPQKPDINRGICSNLGQALGYAVDPFTGLPAFNRDGSGTNKTKNYYSVLQGGGLAPTVTSGVVMIGGTPYYGIIGGGGTGAAGSGLGGGQVVQEIPGARKKVYWYYRAD